MLYQSNNLDIQKNSDLGQNNLEFIFKGHFSNAASTAGAEAWRLEFNSHPETKYTLVWNCTEMTGFDPGARKAWYECMKVYKGRISEVQVISKHLIIRGAAKVMLAVFGVQSKIVRSMEELYETV